MKGRVRAAERLEYAAVLRASRCIALAALVPALLAAGCGSDKNDEKGIGGGSNDLAVSDQLRVIQDKYDIDEFCSVIRAPKDSDLYVRAFTGALDATNDLVVIAKKSPNKIFVAKAYKIKMPMIKFAQQEIARLENKCGKDGRDLAAKLRRELGA